MNICLRILQAKHGAGKESLDWLLRPGIWVASDTFASLVRRYDGSKALPEGKFVHAHIIKRGCNKERFLGNLLVDMYGKCGALQDACFVFDNLGNRNVFSWTMIIEAHVRHNCIDEAQILFNEIPEKDQISFNVIIAALAQHGLCEQAMLVFEKMQLDGMQPSRATFVSLLDACGNGFSLYQGKKLHRYIVGGIFETDVAVATALVTMYGKCGSMDDARRMFDIMLVRNLFSWNTILALYNHHGDGLNALRIFQQMHFHHVMPDSVTFVSILSACSHAGLVDEGLHHYCLASNYAIMPTNGQCNCMIDVLSRVGWLSEAEEFILNMPFEAAAIVWRTLVGACRIHASSRLLF